MMLMSPDPRFAKALSLASALLVFTPAPARAEPAEPAPAEAPKSVTPRGFSTTYTGVPVSIGVMSIVEIPELNEALADQGIKTLPRLTTTLNAGITRVFANRLIIEPQYRFTIVNAEETTVTCHHILLNAGFLVASRGEVMAYPVVGAGFGITTLEFAELEVEGPTFDEVLAKPEGDALLASSLFVLHAGFAANIWGSGHGDFVGLRTGFVFAPVTGGWKRRGYNVYGGPPPPISGAYLALAFGFRAPFER
jgi:hypothetical protein